MLPTSIAGSISIVSPAGGGRRPRPPARPAPRIRSRGPADPDQVGVGLVRAAEVALALDRGVLDHRHVGADRADEPRRPDLGLDLLRRRLADIGAERGSELDLVQAVVAADEHQDQPAPLRRPPGAPSAPPRREPRAPRRPPRPWSARASGLAGLVERRRQLHRLRLEPWRPRRSRHSRGEHDLFSPAAARRHVLVGAGAAHHPDVGFDPVPAHPGAVEDPLVGTGLQRLHERSRPSRSRSNE